MLIDFCFLNQDWRFAPFVKWAFTLQYQDQLVMTPGILISKGPASSGTTSPDVCESKVSPAAIYHDGDNTTDEGAKNEESAKTPSTNPTTTTASNGSYGGSPHQSHKKERYDEGYDVEDDELYMVWARLKALTISECEGREVGDKGETAQELSRGDVGQRSEIFKQNLVVPRKKTWGGTSHTPLHISGDEAGRKEMVDKVLNGRRVWEPS